MNSVSNEIKIEINKFEEERVKNNYIDLINNPRGEDDIVDLRKLKLNYVYNNFKEIIIDLELDYEKYRRSNSKKALLKVLDTRTNYTQGINNSRDYKFNEIVPKPAITMKDLTKRLQLIKLSIINSMIRYNRSKDNGDMNTQEVGVTFTWRYLQESIGMVNYNYIKYQKDHDILAEIFDTDYRLIHEFYETTYANFKKSIIRALNSLQKDGAIMWKEGYYVVYKKVIGTEVVYVNELTTNNETELAMSAKDMALIDIYDNIVIGDNNSESINNKNVDKRAGALSWLYRNNQWDMYYKLINEKMSMLLSDSYDTTVVVTKMYKIIHLLSNRFRFQEFDEILEEYEFNKYQVKSDVKDSVIKNTKARVSKAQSRKDKCDNIIMDNSNSEIVDKEIFETDKLTEKEKMRLGINFFSDFVKIVEFCITRDIELPKTLKKLR